MPHIFRNQGYDTQKDITHHFICGPSQPLPSNALLDSFQALGNRYLHFYLSAFPSRSTCPQRHRFSSIDCRWLCWVPLLNIKQFQLQTCRYKVYSVCCAIIIIPHVDRPCPGIPLPRIEYVPAEQSIPTSFLPSSKLGTGAAPWNECWNWLYFAASNVTGH